jgi:uncharacterized membrane protein YozB (DUF420 family)
MNKGDPVQLLLPLHIFFMALALVLITTAVVIVRRKKKLWMKKHKTFALSGAASSLIGFSCIFSFKIISQFDHFQSIHSIIGIATLALLMVTPALGLSVTKGPKIIRPLHKTFGRITSLAILVTAVSGLFRFLQLTRS